MKKLLLICVILLSVACGKSNSGGGDNPYNEKSLTIIVYMVADNNLYKNAFYDLQEMEYALASIDTDANVVVYVDSYSYSDFGASPQILEVVGDTNTSTIASQVVKTYDERNSVDPAIITSTLNDIAEMYPAENYGLVLWSHATGWLEAEVSASVAANYTEKILGTMTMSYGSDGDSGTSGDGNYYNINNDELSAALPFHFDFIWFDCCLMGNVETLYEYRGNANTLIASPQEILINGMPYEKLIPHMITGDYEAGAQAYYEHYANKEKDLTTSSYCSPYATISVYDASKFDNLASVVATQTSRCGGYPSENIVVSNVQTMGYGSSYQSTFFDLSDAVDYLFDYEALSAVDLALSELITYKAATETFDSVSLDKYCGISCYIPRSTTSKTSQDTYYSTLSWAKAIGWDE